MPLHFTTLPMEIRNLVYGHVFDFTSITLQPGGTGKSLLLTPLPGRDDGFYNMSDPSEILALFFINSQISDEAAIFFYGKMHFTGQWREIRNFVNGIGPLRRAVVRNVEISRTASLPFDFDGGENLELLTRLPSLRKVRITASVQSFSGLIDELFGGGLMEIVGEVETIVYNIVYRRKQIHRDPYEIYVRQEYTCRWAPLTP